MRAVTRRCKNITRHGQSGISLVELLIAMALSLFIVSAAIGVLAMHLKASQSLVAQSRLMLDLRTACDLITRDLRRAGYWAEAQSGVSQPVGTESTHSAPLRSNPYTALSTSDGASASAFASASASAFITYGYSRDATENHAVDSNEQFGFRLRRGAIEMQTGRANWQALTDNTSITVTRLDITPTEQLLQLDALCSTPCPPESAACGPQQRVRSVSVTVSARIAARSASGRESGRTSSDTGSAADASTERTVQTQVRLRNDAITGACPA